MLANGQERHGLTLVCLDPELRMFVNGLLTGTVVMGDAAYCDLYRQVVALFIGRNLTPP